MSEKQTPTAMEISESFLKRDQEAVNDFNNSCHHNDFYLMLLARLELIDGRLKDLSESFCGLCAIVDKMSKGE